MDQEKLFEIGDVVKFKPTARFYKIETRWARKAVGVITETVLVRRKTSSGGYSSGFWYYVVFWNSRPKSKVTNITTKFFQEVARHELQKI